MGSREQPLVPAKLATGIYVAAALVILVALVVHLTGVWDWHIDAGTFALLILFLVIPVAERLRKIKFGKVEAEFAEIKEEVQHVARRVADLNDQASAPSDKPKAANALARRAEEKLPPRTIRRIVWVDDDPAGNRLEIAELRRRFDVTAAASTEQGLKRLVEPEETALITDAVRIEDGTENKDAGLELIKAVRSAHSAVPIYVYCGPGTVEGYSEALESAGARIVTASFTELSRKVRTDARTSFEAEVAAILEALGEVKNQAGIDFVLNRKGATIGVEAKDYRRTPKAAPFDRTVKLLTDAMAEGKIAEGWLVAPRDPFVESQRARTPETVKLMSIDQLRAALAA